MGKYTLTFLLFQIIPLNNFFYNKDVVVDVIIKTRTTLFITLTFEN